MPSESRRVLYKGLRHWLFMNAVYSPADGEMLPDVHRGNKSFRILSSSRKKTRCYLMGNTCVFCIPSLNIQRLAHAEPKWYEYSTLRNAYKEWWRLKEVAEQGKFRLARCGIYKELLRFYAKVLRLGRD